MRCNVILSLTVSWWDTESKRIDSSSTRIDRYTVVEVHSRSSGLFSPFTGATADDVLSTRFFSSHFLPFESRSDDIGEEFWSASRHFQQDHAFARKSSHHCRRQLSSIWMMDCVCHTFNEKSARECCVGSLFTNSWKKTTNSIGLETSTTKNNYSATKKNSHFSYHWDSLDKTICRMISRGEDLHETIEVEFGLFLKAKDRHSCRSRRSDHPPLVCLNGRFPWFLKLTDRSVVGKRYFRLSRKSLSVSFQRTISDSLEHVFLWCVPLKHHQWIM